MLKRLELFEGNLLKFGVAALLIVIPLYPKFPLFQVPGTYVAVRLEDFLIAIILLLWLFREIRHRFAFLKDNLNKIIVTYFVIGFVSIASAIFVTQSVVLHIGLLHTLRRVEYMAVLFIVVASIRTVKQLLFYVQVIFVTLFFVFLYGIGQKFFMFPVISTMNTEFAKGMALRLHPGARISSTFAGHYDLGAYLVLVLPLIVVVFLAVKGKILKGLAGVLFVLAFWLLMASASRISFIAYLISITFTLWFLKKKLLLVPVLAFSIIASLFTPQLTDRYSQAFNVTLIKMKQIDVAFPWDKKPTVISFIPELSPTPLPPSPVHPGAPVKKIREIPTPIPTPSEKKVVFYGAGDELPQTEDRSAAIRFKVEWPRALRALAKNPLLGTGFSSITLATDNDYLRALGEVGILGFAAFGLILVVIVSRVRVFLFSKGKKSIEEMLVIGLFGAFLGFLANAFFIDVFEASKVAITFWLFMGLLVASIKLAHKRIAI